MRRTSVFIAVLFFSGAAGQATPAATKPVRNLQSRQPSTLDPDAEAAETCALHTGNEVETKTTGCPTCNAVGTGTGCPTDRNGDPVGCGDAACVTNCLTTDDPPLCRVNPTSCLAHTTRIVFPTDAPSVAQDGTYQVVASFDYQGPAQANAAKTATAQSVWLTDNFGTVVGFSDTNMATGSATFDVSPAALALNVNGAAVPPATQPTAYSQLPSAFTAHVRYTTGEYTGAASAGGCGAMTGSASSTWDGVVASIVSGAEHCCNALPDAAQTVTLALTSTYAAKQVTLSVNRAGSACAKTSACLASGTCTTADTCDVSVAYVSADDVPIYYKEFTASDAGRAGGSAPTAFANIDFPPTATNLRACAAVRAGTWLPGATADGANNVNWYCYDLSAEINADFVAELAGVATGAAEANTAATSSTAQADASLSLANIISARPAAACASAAGGEYALYAFFGADTPEYSCTPGPADPDCAEGGTAVRAVGVNAPIGFAAPTSGSVQVYACCGASGASPVDVTGTAVSCSGTLSKQTFTLAALTTARTADHANIGGGLSQVSVFQAGDTFGAGYDAPASGQEGGGGGGGLSDTEVAAVVATVCVLVIALLVLGYFLRMRAQAVKARSVYKGVKMATFTHDVETTGAARATPPPPPPAQMSTSTDDAPAGGSTEWVAGSGGSRA